jgi:hypothetical protein
MSRPLESQSSSFRWTYASKNRRKARETKNGFEAAEKMKRDAPSLVFLAWSRGNMLSGVLEWGFSFYFKSCVSDVRLDR